MRIGVPRETSAGERRVALAPESVGRLVKSGIEVVVERGAGVPANFPDDLYSKAGAAVAEAGAAWSAGVVVKVQKPTPAEARLRQAPSSRAWDGAHASRPMVQ